MYSLPSFISFQDEIQGYIQHVSPLQKAGQYKLFDCNIQTRDAVLRAVSFSPSRKRHLDNMMASKSPVKIGKYRKKIRYGEESIIIDEDTTITEADEFDFDFQEGIDTSKLITIESLSKVAIEQLVNVKATIKQLQEVKAIVTTKGSYRKQEAVAVDPTGYINITFWEDQTASVQNDSTYEFRNLRLKRMNHQVYVNTVKGGLTTIRKVENFKKQLPALSDLQLFTTATIVGEIIAISNVQMYNSCYLCSKRVNVNGAVAVCTACNMSLKARRCITQWFARICLEHDNGSKTNLSAYNDGIESLAKICGADLQSTTVEDFTLKVMSLETVLVKFDTIQKKIVSFELPTE